MRWYLGELQLGNLLTKNEQLYRLYCESLPQRAHTFSIASNAEKTYELVNKIWIDPSECIISKSVSGGSGKANEPAKLYASFEINFTPTSILTLNQMCK
ncbi:MAG: hypothetical protein IPG07_08410 [Crocinitomicaceae bacterium]|nr:hypothetical protein [Crocinitomicaceae bacterium]